ncbi:MAG TPA: hypothetical protein VFI25_03705 [Planctomycetota bacterium]|nr:hypothetical protein [Planctomycetota bacterium]
MEYIAVVTPVTLSFAGVPRGPSTVARIRAAGFGVVASVTPPLTREAG